MRPRSPRSSRAPDLTGLARALVSTGINAAPPVDTPAAAPVGIDTVMAAPHFPQPMYESLRDLSQDLLLPGPAHVLPDSVLGLKTNRRFVEAYLVGLNVEMGSRAPVAWFSHRPARNVLRPVLGHERRAVATTRHRAARRMGRSCARRSGGCAVARAVRDADAKQPAAPLSERRHLCDARDRGQRHAHTQPRRGRRADARVQRLDAARPVVLRIRHHDRGRHRQGRRARLLHRDPGTSHGAAFRPRRRERPRAPART